MYINDLEEFLVEKNVLGIHSISNDIENELFVYFKLLVLFYADDCVILAESTVELQNALNEFKMYFSDWKLNVNVEKTKNSGVFKGTYVKK